MLVPQPFVEPTDRRIRVGLADHVVADTQRALLLVQYEPGALPTYYVPIADVRPGALVDEIRTPDEQRRWSVIGGPARADVAAWTYSDPTGPFRCLNDHVTFSWRTLDWFEEDEQVHLHARDPDKRVDTLRSSRHVQVLVDGVPLAESRRPLLLFETSLPRCP